MVKPGGHTEATAFACPQVCGDLACPRLGSESQRTHEEDKLVLRHSGSSNRGRGRPGHKGISVVQEEGLLGLFTKYQQSKKQGQYSIFQGFAIINGDRGIWPLTCCFLTPSASAAAERGTSPCVLNGKCCQLNPDAVSRAFIKPMYQVGIKTTCVLWSNEVRPPITPKSLLVSLCPDPRHADRKHFTDALASVRLTAVRLPVVRALGPCHVKPYTYPSCQVLVRSRAPWVRLRWRQLCGDQVQSLLPSLCRYLA